MHSSLLGSGLGLTLLAALAAPVAGQVRQVTPNIAPATVTKPVLNLNWAPMPPLVAPNLAVGQRIVLKKAGGYKVLERVASGWTVRNVTCVYTQQYIGGKLSSSSSCMSKWEGEARWLPYTLFALVDLSPGAKESFIYSYHLTSTLPGAPAVARGFLFTTLAVGQALELSGGRKLVATRSGWGATHLSLLVADKEMAKWSGAPRLLLNGKGEVAVLDEVGVHQADNWGISVSKLP